MGHALHPHATAPLLVSFLGYPGMLGGAVADCLVSDRFVTPLSAAADYSEALACLPHSDQPHGRARHACGGRRCSARAGCRLG